MNHPINTNTSERQLQSRERLESAYNRKIISFGDLSEEQDEILIEFNGQRYRLRRTKTGRLVLTK